VAEFYGRLNRGGGNEKMQKDFERISTLIAKNGYHFKENKEDVFDLIGKTVARDIWFYDAPEQKITANSKSLEKVFERMF